MLDADNTFASWLNSTTQGATCGLVTITLRDGTVLRWARATAAVSWGGHTWDPHGQGGRPLLSWDPIATSVGLDVGQCRLRLECGATAMLGSKRLPLAAAQGAFRLATLRIERAYMDAAGGSIVGVLPRFVGRVQSWPGTSSEVTLIAETYTSLLNAPLPRTLLQAKCNNVLGDGACGVNLAALTTSTVVGVNGTTSRTQVAGLIETLPAADEYYSDGVLVFTSGACAGERRTIRTHSRVAVVLLHYAQFTVTPPLPSVPQAGDAFTVQPSCALTREVCAAKFSNLSRFRGMPDMPMDGER